MISENDLNVIKLLFASLSQYECNFIRLSGTMISCLNSFSLENLFCIDSIIDDVSVY